jgi:hypothetical protein
LSLPSPLTLGATRWNAEAEVGPGTGSDGAPGADAAAGSEGGGVVDVAAGTTATKS